MPFLCRLDQSYSGISKHALLYGLAMDIITQSHHSGFPHRFLGNEAQQIAAAKVYLNRFNKWSFFGDPDSGWPFTRCPTRERDGFELYHGFQFEYEEVRNRLWVSALHKKMLLVSHSIFGGFSICLQMHQKLDFFL